MKIRKSTEKDFLRIMEIYENARIFMAENGNPRQWGSLNWPPADMIKQDIKEGKSYVCVNDGDEVVGTFFYDYGVDIEETYKVIYDGAWKDDTAYGVVHRIASDHSQKGIGTFCLNWAYEQCGHIKIDTHEDNAIMQSLLEKLGFKKQGIIYVPVDNDPRLAYEKY